MTENVCDLLQEMAKKIQSSEGKSMDIRADKTSLRTRRVRETNTSNFKKRRNQAQLEELQLRKRQHQDDLGKELMPPLEATKILCLLPEQPCTSADHPPQEEECINQTQKSTNISQLFDIRVRHFEGAFF